MHFLQLGAEHAHGSGGRHVGHARVRNRSPGRYFGCKPPLGELQALDEVSLKIEKDKIFGLIGPSGSGKTTLVKVIVGLLRPTEGTATIGGVDTNELGVAERRRLGYMPQDFSLYPSLTVKENANFMASIHGLGWLVRRRRIREVLTFLEIWDARGRLAQDLSGGMRRRLAMAGALLHEPDILVVDEPTAGLDPDLRMRAWDLLRDIRDRGTTILLTTQYLEEAERCDAVAVLNTGRIVATGTPSHLRARADLPDLFEIDASGLTAQIVESLWHLQGVRGVDWDRASSLLIRADEYSTVQTEVVSFLEKHDCVIRASRGRSATFEEVFSTLVRTDGA